MNTLTQLLRRSNMQYCNPDMLHMHTSALKSYAGRKLFAQNYDCTVLAQRGRFAELIAPRSPPLPANRGGKRETEACSTATLPSFCTVGGYFSSRLKSAFARGYATVYLLRP